MPVQDFDIVGSFNQQRVIPFDPERSVNLFEYVDQLGKKPKSLISTSGLLVAPEFFGPPIPLGGFRAQFVFQGVNESQPHNYVVIGASVYRIKLDTSTNRIFTFTDALSTGYVAIDANTNQIIFVDGLQGWIYDVTTGIAVQITDPSFPLKPIDVCNLDGYFVVANGGTNQFQLSSFDNGLIWGLPFGSSGTPATNTFTMAGGNNANIVLTSGDIRSYQIGTPVTFPTSTVAEINTINTYYVVNNSATPVPTIQVSLTPGGTPITSALGGAGTVTNNGVLQSAQITAHPGNIVACRTLHRRLFLFSQNFTEVWENAGAGANLPFRRNNSLLIEYGTPALGTIAVGFDIMVFLSQDKDGLGSVMQIAGTQAVPISTKALDYVLASYVKDPLIGVADARSFLIKENGIIFYRMNFTNANHTWVYNVSFSDPENDATKFWHEEETLLGNRHPAQTHSYFNGQNYVGNYAAPIFYILDTDYLTNAGEPIKRMRISRSFSPPGYQRTRIDRFQLDLLQGALFAPDVDELDIYDEDGVDPLLTEAGINLETEQGTIETVDNSQPTVYLSYSKDGGQTFGNLLSAPMGAPGNRYFRTLWRKLGTIPRGQGFVVKIEFYEEFPFQILGASWAMDILPE